MTVEPVDRQSLLERRSLLFSPDARLGWLFRDRWASYIPFTDLPPQPPQQPGAVQPPAGVPYPPRWARPPAVEPPRRPLPYAPGPPPGYETGPRPPADEQAEDQAWRPGQIFPPAGQSLRNPPGKNPRPSDRRPTGGDDRSGPPPLFGQGNE